ncbi:MAG: HAD family hydrolase [Alphaproteobacteria bacterium]
MPMIVVFDMDNTLVDELGKTVRPGMPALLSRLRRDGVTLILWTSSTRQRARIMLSEHGLDHHFSRFVFREDYDPRNQGLVKDIRTVNGDFLVDDDPKHVDFVRSVGREAFLIGTYRGDSSLDGGELERLYRRIKGVALRKKLFGWVRRVSFGLLRGSRPGI